MGRSYLDVCCEGRSLGEEVGFKCLTQGCDQMFSVFGFIKRPRFLEYGDPFFSAVVEGSDYSMVNSTAFGQLMGKK